MLRLYGKYLRNTQGGHRAAKLKKIRLMAMNMNIAILVLTTIVMLALSFMAFIAIIDLKNKAANAPAIQNISTMSAEDLIEVIIGQPLSEVLSTGDTVELIIRTNDQPIASREYAANDWHGMVKLEPIKAVKG